MSPDAARVLTLVIAMLALLLSVLSFGWQILSWRYTGSFVKVRSQGKLVVHPSGPPGGYLISVTASNVGRTPVTVTGLAFLMRNGEGLISPWPEPWQGPVFPHRLDVGDEVRWYAQEEKLLDGMSGKPDRAEILAEVFLATGKKAIARTDRWRAHWLSIDRTRPLESEG